MKHPKPSRNPVLIRQSQQLVRLHRAIAVECHRTGFIEVQEMERLMRVLDGMMVRASLGVKGDE